MEGTRVGSRQRHEARGSVAALVTVVTRAGRGAGRTARGALGAMLIAALTLLTACASQSRQVTLRPLTSVGKGEGALRLLGVPGYVEDGSTDPRVDWVTAFEHRTGCQVSYTQVPNVSAIQAAFRLHANYYDGVVAPSAVAGQLISAGTIAPLNVQIVGGYPALSRTLRSQAAAISKGKTYGVPYVWDAYVLGYATPAVRPPPRTWAALFDPASSYAGKIMLPDSPFTIALAALYLKSARPALGITDPYELDSTQFAAATGLLKDMRRSIAAYWSLDQQAIDGLATGNAVLGAVLPRHVDILARAGRKVAAADPAQGTTGAVSFWLMSAQARDPNCMYKWLAWSLTPRVQQQVAEWNGTAPVNPDACARLGRATCGRYHVADQAYLNEVAFAHLPGTDCGNGKRDCTGWAAWLNAWKSIAGSPAIVGSQPG